MHNEGDERALRLYGRIQFKGKAYALGLINDAFSIVRAEAEAALREENVRLRGWVAQLCERIEEQWPTGTDASTDAAAARKYLAAQASEAKGESGEAAEKRRQFSLDLLLYEMEAQGHADWAADIRALLARNPTEEVKS